MQDIADGGQACWDCPITVDAVRTATRGDGGQRSDGETMSHLVTGEVEVFGFLRETQCRVYLSSYTAP
jgi:hypothetical protein